MNAVVKEPLEVATLGNANAREPGVHGAMIPVDPASSTYFDVLVGNVFARQGPVVTVRGGTLIRQDGSVRFARRDMKVTIGAATNVTSEDGLMGELDTDAICVGQRIIVFGDACDGPQGVEIDAIEGHVRLGLSSPLGSIESDLANEGRESGGAVSGSVSTEEPEAASMVTPFGPAQVRFNGDASVEGSTLRATLGVNSEIFALGRRRHRPCVGRARSR